MTYKIPISPDYATKTAVNVLDDTSRHSLSDGEEAACNHYFGCSPKCATTECTKVQESIRKFIEENCPRKN